MTGSQHLPLSLDVVPGLDGYRLAFTGDQTFEDLATYPTAAEAMNARRRALAYTAVLDGPDFHIKSMEV